MANRDAKAPKEGLEGVSTSCYNLGFAGLNVTKSLFFDSKQSKKALDHFWQHHENGTVAQSVEQRTFNPLVASSNLARPTIFIRSVPDKWFTFGTEHIVYSCHLHQYFGTRCIL